MQSHRSVLPILRCSHIQSRSAATAAQLKVPGQSYGYSEQFPTPKKWGPVAVSDKVPTPKTWARPGQNESGPSRSRNTERQPTHPNRKPQRESSAPKWTPSSFVTTHKGNRHPNNRPNSAQPEQKHSNNRQATQAKAEEAVTPTDTVVEAILLEPTLYDDGAFVDPQEDEPQPSRKPMRSRTDSYKTRGSVVQTLHSGNEGDKRQKTRPQAQTTQIRKPKPHTPRFQPKPKMDVFIPSMVTVGTLARILDVKFERLIRKMREAGMAEEANHDHVLTSDYAVLLAEELGRNPIVDDEAAFDIYPPPRHLNPSSLPSRAPIVTIMGHVDHGKTTLLDTLRSSAVAKGEAGGITQHIGAFSVPVKSSQGQQSITFLDTPGHAAFSAMRARGAGITDIVVLVVAADDGIMPQTKEVINLLQKDAGRVGLVVAINKVDKPEADVEAVKLALLAEGIQLESFGGDVPSVEVSGLTGKGLPDLVETLSAIAEVQDLRAEKEGPVHGYVLESKVTKGLGPVSTVLVLTGCLKTGSHILSGNHQAKVRAMTDCSGKSVKVAYPGMAVTVSGWKSLPNAGDDVLDGKETEVKKALANRVRKTGIAASLADVNAINTVRKEERERRKLDTKDEQITPTPTESTGPKELKLIIKADVSGSAEAVAGALQGIGNKIAVSRIISSGVGDVTESDVLMAKAVNATLVAFSVAVPRSVEVLAAQNAVPIIKSTIIYRLMEDVQQQVIGLLPIIIESKVTGEATVLQLFDIQLKAKQVKKIAGCRVTNGIVEKAKFARVVRDGKVIHESSLDTMRVLKKDVTEVRKGSECGLSFTEFDDLRVGDMIQMYQTIEKPGIL